MSVVARLRAIPSTWAAPLSRKLRITTTPLAAMATQAFVFVSSLDWLPDTAPGISLREDAAKSPGERECHPYGSSGVKRVVQTPFSVLVFGPDLGPFRLYLITPTHRKGVDRGKIPISTRD